MTDPQAPAPIRERLEAIRKNHAAIPRDIYALESARAGILGALDAMVALLAHLDAPAQGKKETDQDAADLARVGDVLQKIAALRAELAKRDDVIEEQRNEIESATEGSVEGVVAADRRDPLGIIVIPREPFDAPMFTAGDRVTVRRAKEGT